MFGPLRTPFVADDFFSLGTLWQDVSAQFLLVWMEAGFLTFTNLSQTLYAGKMTRSFFGGFFCGFLFFPFESVPDLAQVSSVSLPVSLPVRWRTSCPFLIF